MEASMYGAILGDIIGSPFEFDRGEKTKDFNLFTRGCAFTDDSVMTIAVAEALLAVGENATVEEIKQAVIDNMQDWGNRYPRAGYGGGFHQWLRMKNPKPYGSYGNGSAMRVSAAGWLYGSIERTREVAKATAEVTHNHPEGIKGAEATASCIFLARRGATKDEIRKYVEREFHYDLSRTLDEIRPGYHHVESCQETVPEAITAFLEAVDFEDAIRNAVSLGGDTDTLAAITGSIAEAFFDVPLLLMVECRERIDEEMLDVLNLMDEARGITEFVYKEGETTENELLEDAILQFCTDRDKEAEDRLFDAVGFGIMEEANVIVPFSSKLPLISEEQLEKLALKKTFTLEEDIHCEMETVMDENDDEWIPIFTNQSESRRQNTGNVMVMICLKDIMEKALAMDKVKGVVFNPFGTFVSVTKEFIENEFDAIEQYLKEEANHGKND